jgi:cytochrome c5
MTMNSKHLLIAFVVMASSIALAQDVSQGKASNTQQSGSHANAHASQQNEDEGTRIFQQNCSRCHNTPEGFSPRISGTIIHHMRVRASLSKHEEEELLRFLNP